MRAWRFRVIRRASGLPSEGHPDAGTRSLVCKSCVLPTIYLGLRGCLRNQAAERSASSREMSAASVFNSKRPDEEIR